MMKSILRSGLLLSVILLASCATKYQRASDSLLSYHYGFSETPIDPTTWTVKFYGNESTGADVVERYTLYRAAELTKEKGYDYFVVIDQNQADNTELRQGLAHTSTDVKPYHDPLSHNSGTVTTTTTTHDVTVVNKHMTTKTIRMFKGKKPDTATTYEAQAMLDTMTPYIDR